MQRWIPLKTAKNPAEPYQSLIINDLAGNKSGYKGETKEQHLATFAPLWLNLTNLAGFRTWVFGLRLEPAA